MLKNWIDFLTIVTWLVLGLTLPTLVIRDPLNWGYYTKWILYLAAIAGIANLVLSRNVYLIS